MKQFLHLKKPLIISFYIFFYLVLSYFVVWSMTSNVRSISNSQNIECQVSDIPNSV